MEKHLGRIEDFLARAEIALDAKEGAVGTVVLRVELTKDESEIAFFEWRDDATSYREWLVPASLINEYGSTVIDEELSG